MGHIVGGSYGARIAQPSRGRGPEVHRGSEGGAGPTPNPATLAGQNRLFVRAFFEAISGRPKPTALLDRYVGDPAYLRQLAVLEAAFPGFELEFEDALPKGDWLEVRAVFVGTHRGGLLGLEPTLRTVEQPFRVAYRLEGGRIARHWLGLSPAELKRHLRAEAN